MVLSNKKLKQKLRAELTLNQIKPDSDAPSSSSNSLKLLLHSESHKPILSKRDKLRKLRPLQQQPQPLPSQPSIEDEGTNNKETVIEGLEKKKDKKRKRKVEKQNDDDGVDAANANGVVVKDTKLSKKKKILLKQKKKMQKKKQKEKKKLAKTAEEENRQNHQEEEMPQSTVLNNTTTNTNTNIPTTTTITTSQENGDVATKVYVGGIPYYSTEDDIQSYFEGCGTITDIHCMTFPDTGKFKGIAIISFKTEAAAKRALAFDGADMGGLFLKIQPYKATQATRFTPQMMEGYNRIYVGSLSWEITEEELRKFFSNCNIASIRFGMDKETGEFRGYAHVDFSDSQSLKTALKLDQSVLFGRSVRISCAVPLKKKPNAGEKPDAGETSNGGEKLGAVEKPVAVETPAAIETPAAVETLVEEVVKPSSLGSGKRKNRMCYGCRQKGHNLSECPNNQTGASTTI